MGFDNVDVYLDFLILSINPTIGSIYCISDAYSVIVVSDDSAWWGYT